MLYIGNKKIKELHMGGGKIKESYLGSQLVYSAKKQGFTITNSKNGIVYYRINGSNQILKATLVADEPTFVEVKDTLTSMSNMFYNLSDAKALDVSGLDTKEVSTMYNCFRSCTSLTSLDLSAFVTSNVGNVGAMFQSCTALVSLDLISFDLSHITDSIAMGWMFKDCTSLTHIKCRQAFKDWCWANQDTIALPDTMRSGGSGTWEIVG